MRIADYVITEVADGIAVDRVTDFVPDHVFGNGQSFRWQLEDDGSYTGVVQGKVANVSCTHNRLLIRNAAVEDFHSLWLHYFDLSTNYNEVKKQLLLSDPALEEPIRYGYGLRLLRQEFWEVLASYIISVRYSIPRTRKSIEEICQAYGDPVIYRGRTFHAFPSAEQVVKGGKDIIAGIKMGFKYKPDAIFSAAEVIVQKKFDVRSLGSEPGVEKARRVLQTLDGVGRKVADCTLSFSGIRKDVFPTDTWMKKAMKELYGEQFATEAAVCRYAEKHYGTLMNYAQCYLFYYAWKNKIGKS